MAERTNRGAGDAAALKAGETESSGSNSQTASAEQAISRESLPVHPAADWFPMGSTGELIELGNDIKQNGLLSPIILWNSGSIGQPGKLYLLDGRNRLAAMEAVGIKLLFNGRGIKYVDRGCVRDASTTVYDDDFVFEVSAKARAIRRPGNDAYALVVSANIHRRHLTAEQRRDLITNLIKSDPGKSDRQIAETMKVSPTTVGTVRAKMEAAGDVSKLDTRTDSSGRTQPANKAKRVDVVATVLPMKRAPSRIAGPPPPVLSQSRKALAEFRHAQEV